MYHYIKKHILYKNHKIVLTDQVFSMFLIEIHDLHGHTGAHECVRKINQDFYYPQAKKKACKIIRA